MPTNPDPTPEEVAAAIAAVELSWPRAGVAEPVDTSTLPAYRLSGRWWSAQSLQARPRP
jgi:hypothetical protein